MNVLFKSQTGHCKDTHCTEADVSRASPFSELKT